MNVKGPSHLADCCTGITGMVTGVNKVHEVSSNGESNLLAQIDFIQLLCICALLFIGGCDPVSKPQMSPLPPVEKVQTTDTSTLPPHTFELPMTPPRIPPNESSFDPPDQDLSPPRFMGLKQLIAGDRELYLTWSMAVDDYSPSDQIRYHIFLANRSGKQDFNAPPLLITEPGVTSCRLTGLENGTSCHVVVRASDPSGKSDDNELEWSAVPNPVLFVDSSVESSGSGTHPQSAIKTIDEAIGAAIGLPGVNIFVAAGTYPEQFLLFDGMSLYGGFASGFSSLSLPKINKTIVKGAKNKDSIIIPPGKSLVVIDGFLFPGEGIARRAIVADDCVLRISHCLIEGFVDKGVQIETDVDDGGEASGAILYCDIEKNQGDGLRIEGFVDLSIRESRFRANEQSGISAPSLQPVHGEKTRLDLHRVEISNNGDIGFHLRIAKPVGDDPKDTPRVRISLLGVDCFKNEDHGLGLDLRYTDADPVDLRIRVEHCSIRENKKSGIYLDTDAQGDYSVSYSELIGNRGSAGLYLSGDSTDALVRVRDSELSQNGLHGAVNSSAGLLKLVHSSLHSNGESAVLDELTELPTVQLIECELTPGSNPLKSASPRLWSSISNLPSGSVSSGELDRLPAPINPRITEVVGISPAKGSLTASDRLSWRIFLNQDQPQPQVTLTLDGQPQSTKLDFTADSFLVTTSDLKSKSGVLELLVLIPAHRGKPEQPLRFQYDLKGNR
ncbi:MAG: hypothetical protein CBC13_04865 [Planctomycetia bacterium TMED53]|nr:MAG: hypothetical protein CBC13_04865 [Planctomycetia bacterium TMED53]